MEALAGQRDAAQSDRMVSLAAQGKTLAPPRDALLSLLIANLHLQVLRAQAVCADTG